jgi:flagellar motor switch protein FliN/FliY
MDKPMTTQQSERQDPSAKLVRLQEVPNEKAGGREFLSGNMQLIKDIKVKVTITVGRAELTVAELFALKDDSVLKLDAATTDPVEVLLDGKIIARGNLVVVGEKFGVSITEIVSAPGI